MNRRAEAVLTEPLTIYFVRVKSNFNSYLPTVKPGDWACKIAPSRGLPSYSFMKEIENASFYSDLRQAKHDMDRRWGRYKQDAGLKLEIVQFNKEEPID